MSMEYVVIRGGCGGVELSGVYGSCCGAWKMWWFMGDVVVLRRCNAHGWCAAL